MHVVYQICYVVMPIKIIKLYIELSIYDVIKIELCLSHIVGVMQVKCFFEVKVKLLVAFMIVLIHKHILSFLYGGWQGIMAQLLIKFDCIVMVI